MRVHDNEIISYQINLKESEIRMNTEYDNGVMRFWNELVFSGVQAHYFEDELPGSLILDISILEVEDLFSWPDTIELLHKRKNYGWPMNYDTLENLQNQLKAEGYNVYVISASYGLSGWILAKSCSEAVTGGEEL
ncbi:hypothetical protein [Saccharibacillus qingshengii]|uniref:hypothetical protein n=1 Tax=Saccharibacillus qingshengii TaxID=1763540 RepID=UPI001551669F|nr:hypothetical protein [Saccharibacillus qingshengii]